MDINQRRDFCDQRSHTESSLSSYDLELLRQVMLGQGVDQVLVPTAFVSRWSRMVYGSTQGDARLRLRFYNCMQPKRPIGGFINLHQTVLRAVKRPILGSRDVCICERCIPRKGGKY